MTNYEAKNAGRAIDSYLATIDRLEPEIHSIDPGAFYASAAISLKRIADTLDMLLWVEQEKRVTK